MADMMGRNKFTSSGENLNYVPIPSSQNRPFQTGHLDSKSQNGGEKIFFLSSLL